MKAEMQITKWNDFEVKKWGVDHLPLGWGMGSREP